MRKMLFLVLVLAVAGALSCKDSTGLSGPDSRIAFMSRDSRDVWDIWVVNADGSGLRNLTRSTVEDVYPAWNRERTRIAFRSARSPGGVFVMNARGTGMRLVYSQPDAFIDHVSWSPDGRSLALEVRPMTGGLQIRRVEIDGATSQSLAGGAEAPDWSPDGALIAFYRRASTSSTDIYVMNSTDGTNVRNLTAALPGFQADPSWSPDGQRIAFASGTDVINIWVMNADGSNPVQLSTGPGTDRLPVWSRDGQQIAFQRNTSIWVMNADGTNQRNVTSSLEISGHPSW